MSCNIYVIEDINGLKYVGSTIQTLKKRFKGHKGSKKIGKNTSSCQLDLDNCEIKLLERCDISHRKQRERYWINEIDCVNTLKLNFDIKKYFKDYHKSYHNKNRQQISEYKKNYRGKNLEKIKAYQKKYHEYVKSWGGRKDQDNNSLLKIDTTLFQ